MHRSVTSGILALALCSILVPSAQATTVTVPSGLASGVARAVQDAMAHTARKFGGADDTPAAGNSSAISHPRVAGVGAVRAVTQFRTGCANPIAGTEKCRGGQDHEKVDLDRNCHHALRIFVICVCAAF